MRASGECTLYVNLTPGVHVEAGEGAKICLFVPVPLSQEVNEMQLAPGIGLMMGVSKSF